MPLMSAMNEVSTRARKIIEEGRAAGLTDEQIQDQLEEAGFERGSGGGLIGKLGGAVMDLPDKIIGEVTGSEDAAKANEKAADKLRKEGEKLSGEIFTARDSALGELDPTLAAANDIHGQLSSPGAQEDLYASQLPSLSSPGFTESLYQERQGGGLDKAAQFRLDQGSQALANQFGGRGLQNSGAALEANALMTRGVLADADRERNALAIAADRGRLDRTSALSALAGGSDQGELARLNAGFKPLFDTTTTRADLRYGAGVKAAENRKDLNVAALGGDLAAAQARQKGKSDALNFGAAVIPAWLKS